MKFWVFLYYFLSLGVNASNDRLDVIVGVSDGFPVYYFDQASQRFQGEMVESFQAICEEANLNCIYRSLPKKRVEKQLLHGTIHFGSVIDSAEQIETLKDSIYLTRFRIPTSMGVYSTLPQAQIPTQLEGYYGESIICVLGWSLSALPGVWEAEKEKILEIFPAPSIEAASKMLLQGRAKFLYSNKQKMDVFLDGEEGVYYKPFRTINQTFALSKTASYYETLRHRVEYAIESLVASGHLDPETGKRISGGDN